jgi:DNA-binding NarL/FixJ family response regulator
MVGAPLKVLIADDHPLIAEGIRRGLERSDDIEVVGEAHSGAATMALVERRRPDVVLLDLVMPDVEGTEHIEQIRTDWPEVKVVVLSASEDRASVDAAVNAGANAFVIKSVGVSDLAAILRQVAAGVFLAPARSSSSASDESERPELTERESAILQAIAEGKTTTQISQELYISDHTVKFHLTNVYRKLGVSNRAAAVRWAVQQGMAAR